MQTSIPYTLKRSKRAKRLRLAVYCDGRVVVTTPFWVGESVIEKFVHEKAMWVRSKIQFFKNREGNVTRVFTKEDYLQHKDEALALVKQRIDFFNQRQHFSFEKISIKNQKTRWGSCSKNKNINFNYKILFLPSPLQDYIIVHELCHLKELNHSKKFWALVENIFPEYKTSRKALRKHGLRYQ